MKTRSLVSIAIFAAFGCASHPNQPSRAPQSTQLACSQLSSDSTALLSRVLTPGSTSGARPLTETRFVARAHQPTTLVGAQMDLPAPEGVTKEYLQRVLTCHADVGAALHASDPFHPSTGTVVDIAVRSSGAMFAIQIRGDETATGEVILARVRELSAPTVDVGVEQVGWDGRPSNL